MSMIDDADDTAKDAIKRARNERENQDDSEENPDGVYPDDKRDTSGEVPVENLE